MLCQYKKEVILDVSEESFNLNQDIHALSDLSTALRMTFFLIDLMPRH